MPSGIRSLPRYQKGGRVDPTRREFLERLARIGGGAFLSQNLPGMGELPVEQMGVGASPTIPKVYSRDFLSKNFLTGPTSLSRLIDRFEENLVHGPNKEFVSKATGEIMPLWTKGGPPGSGFSDWLAAADDALDHIPPLAPEMTAHGVTHPSMRAALLEEGAKMAPGEIIDPEILLERIGYNREIGQARSNVEGYRTALESIEKGDGPSVFRSKEEHLAHYRAQQTEAKEELARLLRAKARSDEAVKRTGGMFFGPSYNDPGILDSPSVRPSPSTAGRWGMRRGIGAFLGALGMGLGTAVDLAASPTKLGSGDLPESPRFTDEEMEIIRAKQREEFQLLENLGLTPRLPIGPRVSPQGASIRPRGFGRASGGIIGLGRVA